MPMLMYWDIYKNYYCNKQEGVGAVIQNIFGTMEGNVISFAHRGKTDLNIWSYYTINANIDQSRFPISLTPNSLSKEFRVEGNGLYPGTIDLYYAGSSSGTPQWTHLEDIPYASITYNSTNTRVTIKLSSGDAWLFNPGGNVFPVRHVGAEISTSELGISTFPLENIDNMREAILAQPKSSPLILNDVQAGQNLPYARLS